MADYYPSIAQAVSALRVNTAVARRSIYDRARTAMAGQFRDLAAALSDAEINRELLSLERAIRKVEQENLSPPRIPAEAPPIEPAPLPRARVKERDDQQVQVGQSEPVPWTYQRPQPPSMTNTDAVPARRQHKAAVAQHLEHVLMTDARHQDMASSLSAQQIGRGWQRKVGALAIAGMLVTGAGGLGLFWGPELLTKLSGPLPSTAVTKNANKIVDRVASPLPSNLVDVPKAVLYEEDESDPLGRRFAGSAEWRTETLPTGPGQSPKLALRADIQIPDQHVFVRWTLTSNDDETVPASHSMELAFSLPPDFPHGGISGIPGVLMKQAEASSGIPLAGLGIKVTSNIFLVSLSSAGPDAQRNAQLLKERSWVDIPFRYNDGRRAILAFEKGPSGDRAFSDAFESWETFEAKIDSQGAR